MVFTNPIMTTHVNKIADRPSISSMVDGTYKSVDATSPRRGYQKPYVVTSQILDHKDGHSIRQSWVAFKYLDLKKMIIQMFMSECSILQ